MKSLVPHNPSWASEFQVESTAIAAALGNNVSAVHHIGSTSISGIHAKPIIDILVEVSAIENVDTNHSAMVNIGYECMGEYGISGRRYFRKINAQSIRTHHVHMFSVESDHIIRHLAFRNYLRQHPVKAQEYSALKQALAADPKNNWDHYIDGKDPFIKMTEKNAVAWYRKNM